MDLSRITLQKSSILLPEGRVTSEYIAKRSENITKATSFTATRN